jgi:pilus assembly protein CpaC
MSRRLPVIRRAVAAVMAAALLGAPGAAPAETALAGGPPAASDQDPGVIRVDLSAHGPASRVLAVGKGKSALIELPIDARDITVASPAVADVVLRTPRRISVLGIATGQTDAVFFDGMGRAILSLDIRVDQDASALSQTLARVLPSSRIKVEAVNNSLILTGVVMSASDAEKAQQIAAQFVAKPDLVLNMLSVAGKDQVMLKVRVIEVQRTAIKQLGYDFSSVVGQVGGNQWVNAFGPTWGVNGQLLGGLTGGFARDTTSQPILQLPCTPGDFTHLCPFVVKNGQQAANFNAAAPQTTAGSDGLNKANAKLQAFERAGLIRNLAEPDLTAVSGEAAKFLVGGEFPVPTGEDAQGRISVEYKQFGVGLGFTPVVLAGGRISLKLSTEVSELSNLGAFTINNGNGAPSLTIPGLNVRRAETTVELPSGGSLMIAGLLQEETKQDIDSLPGLMDLPILGALFRSRDYQNGQTELVVIVTPYLVDAAHPGDLQTPADGLQIADDAETILLGKLAKAAKAPPEAIAGRTYQGPYGYVIE